MGKFYLDMEWTNGNFYLGDIFEIAIVSEDSGNIYHSYVKMHYKLPQRIKFLCGICDEVLINGNTFKKVFQELTGFIEREQSSTPPVIIAQGGFDHHFPMLLSNCMKHKCNIAILKKYAFVDSMLVLKQLGYPKPGLETLITNLIGKKVKRHSALSDAKALK